MTATASTANPLLEFSGLPRFGEIRPEHVTPAIDALLADAEAALHIVTDDRSEERRL